MTVKSYIIPGYDSRTVSIDVRPASLRNGPLLLFVHGFKGFKDWGHFPLVGDKFCEKEVNFVSFNFSHNGTSPDSPSEFVDLVAFGKNTFSIELTEVRLVVDWLLKQNGKALNFDSSRINLLGHSRGGGIVILAKANDVRINNSISWAAVDDFGRLFQGFDKVIWRKQGVATINNSRTRQIMPLNYTLYSDYDQNKDYKLNILLASKKIKEHQLIIHGTDDSSVNCDAAQNLYKANPKSMLHLIEGADHTFGGKHPWERSDLPRFTLEAIEKTIEMIQER